MFLSTRRICSVISAGVVSVCLCIASSPAMATTVGFRTAGVNPGAAVSLNPQPIPPGISGLGGRLSVNPQPLPPGVPGQFMLYQ
jgi:hypothetical protein